MQKIYTEIHFTFTPENGMKVEDEKSYMYTGPIAEAKGGVQGSTETVNSGPWEPQQQYILDMMEQASQLNQNTSDDYFAGNTVAGVDPNTTQAQNTILDYAQNTAPDLISNVQDTWQRNLNASDVGNNQYVLDAVSAATNPIMDRLMREVLPQVSSQAQLQGAYGGARQGLLEGQAIGDTNRAIGDTSAAMFLDAYNRGLQAEQAAMGMSRDMTNLGTLPAQMQEAVGQQRTGYEQSLIDADLARWQYEQQAPWLRMANYAQLIGQNYGTTGSNTVTPLDPNQPNNDPPLAYGV